MGQDSEGAGVGKIEQEYGEGLRDEPSKVHLLNIDHKSDVQGVWHGWKLEDSRDEISPGSNKASRGEQGDTTPGEESCKSARYLYKTDRKSGADEVQAYLVR